MASVAASIHSLDFNDQQCTINGINVSSLVPSFRITKQGFELGNKAYVVHMRRKYTELNLFLMPLYYAAFTHYLEHGVDPMEMYEKVYYDSIAYKRRKGVLMKNTNQKSHILSRLWIQQTIHKRHGFTWTYRFVNARYSDPNSPVNYGFSFNCCSINTVLFINADFMKRVGDYENYDYASFFEEFLRKIHYDKALYIVNKKYRTLHRLMALQRLVENRVMDVRCPPTRMEEIMSCR